jgi:D-alanine--D-alanine ligase
VGLRLLGHEIVFVDSAEIQLRVAEISEQCDLVIDHTDTYRNSGMLRPFVRGLLEAHGARIVGSNAAACFLADDKPAAKACLIAAGIPTPPGIAVTSNGQALPGWLRPPVVVKPAYEHMSRGLHIAGTHQEIHEGIAALLERFRQPVLVEAFIPGREIAVSVLEMDKGPVILPPLEWRVHSDDGSILTETFKHRYVTQERQDVSQAELSEALKGHLTDLCLLAFRTLGLRDYARFDLRLSPGGTFYFLEANTTPSLEPLEALALSARWAGLDYASLVQNMLAAAQKRYGSKGGTETGGMHIEIPAGSIDIDVPEGVHRPPESSVELAGLLDVRQGDHVLDLGCGSGLLSIAAAKLGAERVVATDIDVRALAATGRNARANLVGERIETRSGSWFEALDGCSRHAASGFDMIIATPPQMPGPHSSGTRYGGPDGARHTRAIIEGAAAFLKPRSGRLWLLVISLANPAEVLARLRRCFHEVSIVRESERFFTSEEYEAVTPGLMTHFIAQRASGMADFREDSPEGYVFKNLFIRAQGVKAP